MYLYCTKEVKEKQPLLLLLRPSRKYVNLVNYAEGKTPEQTPSDSAQPHLIQPTPLHILFFWYESSSFSFCLQINLTYIDPIFWAVNTGPTNLPREGFEKFFFI